MRSFKAYVEATDIFGFETKKTEEPLYDELDNKPLQQFNVESMIEYLARKRLGMYSPQVNFMNEIQWGERAGAVKLEVAPRMAFHVKKLGFDVNGHSRWISKKMFQLNRTGAGGYEDSVANEIYEVLLQVAKTPLESAKKDFDHLDRLVEDIATKMRRVAKPMFIYEGIRKLSDENYIIKFSVRGQGVEAPHHQRIEEVLTQITYDKDAGTIRVTNYKVASDVGGPRSWKIKPSDLDLFFFPSQDRDEISETIAVHFKYY